MLIFVEIVKVRFGTGAHLLFTFYGFLCILVVSGSLLRKLVIFCFSRVG